MAKGEEYTKAEQQWITETKDRLAQRVAAMKKADDGIPATVAPIEEVQLYVRDATGKRQDVSFLDLIEKTLGKSVPRADLHISRSRDGELFLTSRQDGMIRMPVPDDGPATSGGFANRHYVYGGLVILSRVMRRGIDYSGSSTVIRKMVHGAAWMEREL